jgi:hypothetical protein
MTSVFVSSTSKDLLDHRAAAIKACLDAGFHPIGMENFMARTEDAVTACLDEVAASDIFIGIYAWRYGYVPPNSKCSITEMEYLKARELKKPCFCFLVDPSHPWPDEFKDKGLSEQFLAAFKTGIESSIVRASFTTPEDLGQKVAATLARWLSQAQPIAKPVVEPVVRQHLQIQADIQRLQREINGLEEQRSHLLRQKAGTQAAHQRNANFYIVLGVVFLCMVGAAFTQSTVLGLIVLVAMLGGFYLITQAGQQEQQVADRDIAMIESEIRRRVDQLHASERKLQNL